MIFYFTATGNSLYVAKQLDEERLSIPQEMNRENRRYKAERIGIVCPLFEFEIPSLVKDFIRDSEFETDYFYLVVTYGMHHGGVAERTQAWLESIGRAADYVNTIIMHDNALIVFDMDQQRSVEAEKRVDAHIDAIRSDIAEKKAMTVADIPCGCESIGDHAFRNCSSLAQIRIPASVTSIGEGVFDGCGTVCVFGPAGSAVEDYCAGSDELIFIAVEE